MFLNSLTFSIIVLGFFLLSGQFFGEVLGCQTQDECPENMTCTLRRCYDLCEGMACGHNAVCKTEDHFPTCECLEGYVRMDPSNITSDCVQCRSQNDCPANLTCTQGSCEDLCDRIFCDQKEVCQTTNHFPMCDCVSGYFKVDPSNSTSACMQCQEHSNCAQDEMCISGLCEDACHYHICGLNSDCKIQDNQMNCECISGYFKADPYNITAPCQRITTYIKSEELEVEVRDDASQYVNCSISVTTQLYFSLRTSYQAVEITKLRFYVYMAEVYNIDVSVEQIEPPAPNTTSIHFSGTHTRGVWDDVPLSIDNRPLLLSPYTKYRFYMSCDQPWYVYSIVSPMYTNDDVTVVFPIDYFSYPSAAAGVYYKTLTPVG